VFLGFDKSLQSQHEHDNPSHLINTSRITSLLCLVDNLLPESAAGIEAVCFSNIPLQIMNHNDKLISSETEDSKLPICLGLILVVKNTI
jgi:hypothetical protein